LCTVPCIPAGVFGATVTVPSVFTVNGPFGVEVITTSAGLTAVPFNVSLSKTLIPESPPTPLIGPATSSIASIGDFSTGVTVAVSQFVGFNTSQMCVLYRSLQLEYSVQRLLFRLYC
jgi:hypothetical protein